LRTAPTNDPECPFCAIIGQNDLNIREIYRDDQTVAFFPKSPAVLGHTLVIPTIHVATVWKVILGVSQVISGRRYGDGPLPWGIMGVKDISP